MTSTKEVSTALHARIMRVSFRWQHGQPPTNPLGAMPTMDVVGLDDGGGILIMPFNQALKCL